MQRILKRLYFFLEKEFNVPHTEIEVEIPDEFIQKIKEGCSLKTLENHCRKKVLNIDGKNVQYKNLEEKYEQIFI